MNGVDERIVLDALLREHFASFLAKSFQSVTRFIEELKGLEGMQTVKPLSTNVRRDEASGRDLVVFSILFSGVSPVLEGPDA